MNVKVCCHFFIAFTLLILPACEQNRNVNRQNGLNDAVGARPYEEIRDAAEDAGDAVRETGRDIKDAVNGP